MGGLDHDPRAALTIANDRPTSSAGAYGAVVYDSPHAGTSHVRILGTLEAHRDREPLMLGARQAARGARAAPAAGERASRPTA